MIPSPDSVRVSLLLALTLLLAVMGCRVTSLPLWHPHEPPAADRFDVVSHYGVKYSDTDESFRHSLDIFVPKTDEPFPVVVLVHGGAWLIGDNRCCGLYSSIGKYFASRGVGVVLPNYRLSPAVKHPEHARDVARAVAWTREHIGAYGGSADNLFLAGHSAGGHLAALLATDARYLKERGVEPDSIRGVIAISGVYRIPEGDIDFTLGGDKPNSLRVNEVMPVRGGCLPDRLLPLPGVNLSVNLLGLVFGNDPRVRAAASPVEHVHAGLPPFLIISAEKDLPLLVPMAREFHQALLEHGCAASYLRVPDRNHNTILFRAMDDGDPVARAVLDFVRVHAQRP